MRNGDVDQVTDLKFFAGQSGGIVGPDPSGSY
jgi:hypothetical protein